MEFDIGLITKFTSVACAGLLIGLVIWNLSEIKEVAINDVQQILIDANLIMMGLILVLSEFGLDMIKENFYFVAQLFGRGLFCIFLGTWVMTYKQDFNSGLKGYDLATGIILMVTGAMYIVFYFLFPNKNASEPSPAPGK